MCEAMIHPLNMSSSVEFQAQKSENPFAGVVIFGVPRGRAHSAALNDPVHRQR